MFDFESDLQFGQGLSARIVNPLQARQTAEARRRDIYDSHRHRVFSLAYYMTGSEPEAERILTETFVRAFHAVPEPKSEDVDSALIEEFHRRTYLQLNLAAPSTPCTDDPGAFSASLTGRNVKRTELECAIWCLPACERLLFLLRDVEGYAPAAIAQLLNLPESEVHRGIFAARILLRRILAEGQPTKAKAEAEAA